MNKEMVQALGINIKRVFLFVFMTGAALAALGGVLMAPYSGVDLCRNGNGICHFRIYCSSYWWDG